MRAESSGHPESVNHRLADFLGERRESICEAWSKRVGRDPRLKHRRTPPVPHQVSELLCHLDERLRHSRFKTGADSGDAENEAEATEASPHALRDTLRDIQHLRSDLLYHLRTFEDHHPEFGLAAMHFVSHVVHSFLDDLMIEAAGQSAHGS